MKQPKIVNRSKNEAKQGDWSASTELEWIDNDGRLWKSPIVGKGPTEKEALANMKKLVQEKNQKIANVKGKMTGGKSLKRKSEDPELQKKVASALEQLKKQQNEKKQQDKATKMAGETPEPSTKPIDRIMQLKRPDMVRAVSALEIPYDKKDKKMVLAAKILVGIEDKDVTLDRVESIARGKDG